MYIQGNTTMQIAKWGNSLALRIPANVAKSLELKAGDEVEIVASPTGFEVIKDDRKSKALETLNRFKGRLPKNFTFNRDELNER
jgi:antitoxin MazE